MTKDKSSVDATGLPTPKNKNLSSLNTLTQPLTKVGEKQLLSKVGDSKPSNSRKSRNVDRPQSGTGLKKGAGLSVSSSIETS